MRSRIYKMVTTMAFKVNLVVGETSVYTQYAVLLNNDFQI